MLSLVLNCLLTGRDVCGCRGFGLQKQILRAKVFTIYWIADIKVFLGNPNFSVYKIIRMSATSFLIKVKFAEEVCFVAFLFCLFSYIMRFKWNDKVPLQVIESQDIEQSISLYRFC